MINQSRINLIHNLFDYVKHSCIVITRVYWLDVEKTCMYHKRNKYIYIYIYMFGLMCIDTFIIVEHIQVTTITSDLNNNNYYLLNPCKTN